MGSRLRFQVTGKAPVFIRNREFGDTKQQNKAQAVGASDGLQIYAYDMGLERTTYAFQLSEVPKDQLDELQRFFDDDAQGAFNPWDLTIPGGDPALNDGSPKLLQNCRFAQGGLQHQEVHNGWFDLTLTFFTQEEGPTGPPTTEA